MAPTSLTMWSGWPSFKMNLLQPHTAEWIIVAVTGISVCSPLFKTPFTAVVLDGFLLSMKDSSSTTWLLFSSFFFGLGVTNNAGKPNCVLPIGDNVSSYDDCSSGELIVININETQLSWKQQLCQGMQISAITLWFPKQCLFGFFILEKQLASQNIFLVRSALSITAYLLLVFYRTTSLQSLSFLKNIEILCK